MSNQDEKDKLEQDARIALLQHYSAKASNQAVIIVTLAIVFFAFIQTLVLGFFRNKDVAFPYELTFLTVLFFVGFRAILKLVDYGFLTANIQTVRIKSEQETFNSINAGLRLCYREGYWKEGENPRAATYLVRLSEACGDFTQKAKKGSKEWNYRLYSYADKYRWAILGSVSAFVLLTSIIINRIIVTLINQVFGVMALIVFIAVLFLMVKIVDTIKALSLMVKIV
jgi:hypothetical protein